MTATGGIATVAVDGPDAADPVAFADRLVARVRANAGAAHRVSLHDYVRPASLRYEYGRTDELSYRTAWFDYDAVDREVLGSLRTAGTWLPALWDEATDRSARARVQTAAPTEIVVVAGPMLLGRGLAFDVTVSLVMDEAAMRRSTPPEDEWTIAPILEHAETVTETVDFAVKWNHPDRPALIG